MENHTYCAENYREQIQNLESIYNEERHYQREEERKKRLALYGENYRDEETKVTGPVKQGNVIIADYPCGAPLYKGRA